MGRSRSGAWSGQAAESAYPRRRRPADFPDVAARRDITAPNTAAHQRLTGPRSSIRLRLPRYSSHRPQAAHRTCIANARRLGIDPQRVGHLMIGHLLKMAQRHDFAIAVLQARERRQQALVEERLLARFT